MPQLQVVNTGGSPLNTALGNISAGFIESFNKRAETARNDEIFSRIKSKYGPKLDADTIYKDILQSEGFDQSYKNNILKQVSDYSALQRNEKRTVYEQMRLAQLQDDLNIKKFKAEQDPATKPMTPYERNIIQNRQRYLDLQENKLKNSVASGSNKLGKDFASYSNAVLKLSARPILPEDKALIDTVGINAIRNGADIQTAFNAGYQAYNQKKQIEEEATPPIDPKSNWTQPTPAQEQQAKQDLFDFLSQVYNAGIKDPKKLRGIAARGKWSSEEANQVIQKIMQNPEKRSPKLSQEQVNNILFQ